MRLWLHCSLVLISRPRERARTRMKSSRGQVRRMSASLPPAWRHGITSLLPDDAVQARRAGGRRQQRGLRAAGRGCLQHHHAHPLPPGECAKRETGQNKQLCPAVAPVRSHGHSEQNCEIAFLLSLQGTPICPPQWTTYWKSRSRLEKTLFCLLVGFVLLFLVTLLLLVTQTRSQSQGELGPTRGAVSRPRGVAPWLAPWS